MCHVQTSCLREVRQWLSEPHGYCSTLTAWWNHVLSCPQHYQPSPRLKRGLRVNLIRIFSFAQVKPQPTVTNVKTQFYYPVLIHTVRIRRGQWQSAFVKMYWRDCRASLKINKRRLDQVISSLYFIRLFRWQVCIPGKTSSWLMPWSPMQRWVYLLESKWII